MLKLAEIYRQQGRYVEAEPIYGEALAIIDRDLGETLDSAAALFGLGLLSEQLGRFESARTHYQEATRIARKGDAILDHPVVEIFDSDSLLVQLEGRLTLVSGKLFLREGKCQQAINLYLKFLSRKERESENRGLSANIWYDLGEAYYAQSSYAEAAQAFLHSIEVLGRDNAVSARAYSALGDTYRERGMLAEATKYYEVALSGYKQTFGIDHPEIARTFNALALTNFLDGNANGALDLYTQGLEVDNRSLSQNLLGGSDAQKLLYVRTFAKTTNEIISLHLDRLPENSKSARNALLSVLRGKGRVLDIFANTVTLLRQRLGPSEQAIFKKLESKHRQISNLASNPEADRRQLPVLEAEVEDLQRQLFDLSRAYSKEFQPIALDAVQSAIPTNTALVEFVEYQPFDARAPQGERRGQPRYAASVLLPKGNPKWVDLGAVEEIAPLLEEYQVTTLNRRVPEGDRLAAAQALEAKLIAPIRKMVGKANHLFLSPEGALNQISFAALVDNQGRYLIEDYILTYLTSGLDLLRLQTPPLAGASGLLIANPTFGPETKSTQIATAADDLAQLTFRPLPGTTAEASAIAPLLGVEPLTGEQATEAAVKVSDRPRIFHLATHGFFLPDLPPSNPEQPSLISNNWPTLPLENPLLRSGLALAGFNLRGSNGAEEDGALTALEVTGLDLRGTELVVLSACQTGLGDIATGEGVYGLRRAFTLAGAQSQVVSLWKVGDTATKDLMVAYYQKLLQEGEGRSEALRKVQLAMMRGELRGEEFSYKHPYNWAAFIPGGNWTPLDAEVAPQ